MLKHGASPSSSTVAKLWLFEFTTSALCSTELVVDICIKYDDFASLRDLQQDSAEAPTKPVKPESSAYDSALEDSVRSTSTPSGASEASDGLESVPDNPAGEDKIKINELKFSAQPQRKNKRGSPPQSVRVPYPESPCH